VLRSVSCLFAGESTPVLDTPFVTSRGSYQGVFRAPFEWRKRVHRVIQLVMVTKAVQTKIELNRPVADSSNVQMDGSCRI